MAPNEYWDDRLLQERLGSIDDQLRALRDLPTSVARNSLRVDELNGDLEDFKGWLHDMEQRLGARIDQLAADFRAESDARRKARTTIVVAMIGASGAIVAALIGLAATVWS